MVHIRINLNDDGTANYYRWVPATPEPGCVLEEWEGEYDFATLGQANRFRHMW